MIRRKINSYLAIQHFLSGEREAQLFRGSQFFLWIGVPLLLLLCCALYWCNRKIALRIRSIYTTSLKVQHNAEKQLVDVLESMGDGFSAMDKDFNIIRVNHHQERFSGLKREQTLGRNHWDLRPRDAVPKLWDAYRFGLKK